jgi:two-component system chemotaxis family response regulator WspR
MTVREPSSVVLVIDDNDIDRMAMVDLLIAAGLDVHELPSPIGATRVARQMNVRVVVIDQNLPAMDGAKLAALFRGNPAMRDIGVVLVSGSDEDAMRDLVKRARIDAFVSKRDLQRELVHVVKRLLA